MAERTPADVAAVVCTRNSVAGIRECLSSARAAGVGELIVVDAGSTDGTLEAATELADQVLHDPGIGLGNARNVGIAQTSAPLVLNLGSDNVLPSRQLNKMIAYLDLGRFQGVGAQTVVRGRGYLTYGLNAWRSGKFPIGPASVIGTPTLFEGDLLRANLYQSSRRFSDDSELCERWAREFDARFAISDAYVEEVGKTSWNEVVVRCKMYGESDDEVYRDGVSRGWGLGRRMQSLGHPLTTDALRPTLNLGPSRGAKALPFLTAFVGLRYAFWAKASLKSGSLR